MPQKNFEIWINPETKILVKRRTEKGRMVTFSIVLVILTENGWQDISRFDTAHGTPHQDVLGKVGGLLQKIWLDDLSSRAAYHFALVTFQTQYENIRNEYLAN